MSLRDPQFSAAQRYRATQPTHLVAVIEGVAKSRRETLRSSQLNGHPVGHDRFVHPPAVNERAVSTLIVEKLPARTWDEANMHARDRRMVELQVGGCGLATDHDSAVGRAKQCLMSLRRHD